MRSAMTPVAMNQIHSKYSAAAIKSVGFRVIADHVQDITAKRMADQNIIQSSEAKMTVYNVLQDPDGFMSDCAVVNASDSREDLGAYEAQVFDVNNQMRDQNPIDYGIKKLEHIGWKMPDTWEADIGGNHGTIDANYNPPLQTDKLASQWNGNLVGLSHTHHYRGVLSPCQRVYGARIGTEFHYKDISNPDFMFPAQLLNNSWKTSYGAGWQDNFNVGDVPRGVWVRLDRQQNREGNMTQEAQIAVEYHCTIIAKRMPKGYNMFLSNRNITGNIWTANYRKPWAMVTNRGMLEYDKTIIEEDDTTNEPSTKKARTEAAPEEPKTPEITPELLEKLEKYNKFVQENKE